MKLKLIKELVNTEIVHYFEENKMISSLFNIVKIQDGNSVISIVLPISKKEKVLGRFRIFRRLLRYDKCNVISVEDNVIIIRRGVAYQFNLIEKVLHQSLILKNCNNVMHQSICISPNKWLFFGEYGNNKERDSVNIYCSKNFGKTWEVVHVFKNNEIRHVHGCYYDKYENKIWTLTGDYENENYIIVSDLDFKNVEVIGNGSQSFRAVNVFFEKNKVHWIMDSPLEKSYQFSLTRKTREVKRTNLFPGPVWYLKRLNNGYYLAGTSVEHGDGVLEKSANLFISKNLESWECIAKFEKDLFPMPLFKWGVMAFSDGDQNSEAFTIHFEALKNMDGKSYLFSLVDG